jgi:hypothetical protein
LALTSNVGSLFIFAKSTFYLGWQKKNFLSWRSVISPRTNKREVLSETTHSESIWFFPTQKVTGPVTQNVFTITHTDRCYRTHRVTAHCESILALRVGGKNQIDSLLVVSPSVVCAWRYVSLKKAGAPLGGAPALSGLGSSVRIYAPPHSSH